MDKRKKVRDILLSIPFGLLYVLFVNKIIKLLQNDTLYEDKIKKTIALSFFIVIIGLVLSFKVFSSGHLKNRIIKYSLIFGSIIIFANSIMYNWPLLSTDTKALIIGLFLVSSFFISYKYI